MQARIDTLQRVLNETVQQVKEKEPGEAAIYRLLQIFIEKRLSERNKSEFLKQQEFEAIAYFATYIRSIFSFQTCGDLFGELVARLISAEHTRLHGEDLYYAVIKAGLDLIKRQHEPPETKDDVHIDNKRIAPDLEQPLFDLTPEVSRDYVAMKAKRQMHHAECYAWYVNLRREKRNSQLQLQNDLAFYKALKPWATGFSFIPGIYFLTFGLADAWTELKQGNIGSAICLLLVSLVVSLIPILNCYNAAEGMDSRIRGTQRALNAISVASDRVVAEVVSEELYDQLKNSRKGSTEPITPAIEDPVTQINAATQPLSSKSIAKPKKIVVPFTDPSGKKMVRLFMDKAQAERFNEDGALMVKSKKGAEGSKDPRFFARTSKLQSKLQSIQHSDAVYRAWERAHARPR